MNLKRIDHLNIVVSDMDASIEFYCEAFGFKKTLDLMLDEPWFETVTHISGAKARCVFLEIAGSPRIELLQYIVPATAAATTSGLNVAGQRHFALEVSDIQAMLNRLQDMGISSVSEIVEVPRAIIPQGKRLVYLHAPDDVCIELNQYGD